MRTNERARNRLGSRALCLLAVAGLVTMAAACSDILEVQLPGQITEGELLQPQLATTMVNGAISTIECGYNAWGLGGAGMAQEFEGTTGWHLGQTYSLYMVFDNTGSMNTERCWAPQALGIFLPLQMGRSQAEKAYHTISDFDAASVPNRAALLAQAAAYAGLVYTTFGESWCEMAVNEGPLMDSPNPLKNGIPAALDSANLWYARALEQIAQAGGAVTSPGTSDLASMVYLLRARTKLRQWDYEGAAADAERITKGFIANATRSEAEQNRWNLVGDKVSAERRGSVGPLYRNLTVGGKLDPRVQVTNTGVIANDGQTIFWRPDKFKERSDNYPIVRWAEAQLILAEVELRHRNNPAKMAEYINNVRSSWGIEPYSLPAGATEERLLLDLLEERRREFFFEGRRYVDMLRYDRAYPSEHAGPGVAWDFFPRERGFTSRNVPYGPATCFPLSRSEKVNNPHLTWP